MKINKKLQGLILFFMKTNEEDIMCASKSAHKLYNGELLCELSTSNIKKSLSDETFTICFNFQVFHDLFNHDICHTHCPTKYINNFTSDDSLITLIINKKSLQISRDLLCLNSKVFETMFCSCLIVRREADNKIEITDINYYILKELLSFLKNGYLSEKIKTNAEALCQLYLTAEKYEIKHLKSICEKYIIMNTTIKNVVGHLFNVQFLYM